MQSKFFLQIVFVKAIHSLKDISFHKINEKYFAKAIFNGSF